MLISRLLPMGRIALKGVPPSQARRLISTSIPRPGGHAPWTYREFTPASPFWNRWADCAGAIIWWWIFWHLFTDYGHLIGEKPFVDAGDWTDAELGIPPDDADDPE